MDHATTLIQPGGELPKVGVPMKLISHMTKTAYKFVPKRITELRWNSKGKLIVEMDGIKRRWEGEDK